MQTSIADRQPQFDPIRVEGGLRISLLGLTLGHIRLHLDITSLNRLAHALVAQTTNDERAPLSSLSKSVLYDMARDEEITGRSSMSREELLVALGIAED